jgi:hypothetical protein
MAKKFVQRQQRDRRVAAASAQAGGDGDVLLQMDANPFVGGQSGGRGKKTGGLRDEIFRVD